MDRKGAEMKIYNKITKQFVKSDKLRKLDDCFIIEDTERYEKTIRYFFKPQKSKEDFYLSLCCNKTIDLLQANFYL